MLSTIPTFDTTGRIEYLFGTRTPQGSVPWTLLEASVARCGSCFFDRDTMRAFGSRRIGLPKWVEVEGSPVVLFMTSERDTSSHPAWDGQRRYTLRAFDPSTGRIRTYPGTGFGEYRDSAALRAAFNRVPTL